MPGFRISRITQGLSIFANMTEYVLNMRRDAVMEEF